MNVKSHVCLCYIYTSVCSPYKTSIHASKIKKSTSCIRQHHQAEAEMKVIYICIILLVLARVSRGETQCPPWFAQEKYNNSAFPQCVCSEGADTSVICNQKERTSYMKLGHCIFQDYQSGDTFATSCPYVFPTDIMQDGLIQLPDNVTKLNMFICGHLQRDTGTLFCSRCTNGTGPAIYSYGSQCATCSTLNILYYLLLVYVPITIMYLSILLFRLSLVSPPIGHYILYCNIVALAIRTHGHSTIYASTNKGTILLIKLLLTLCSIWTIDTLRFISPPLCISQSMEDIYTPGFDAIAALYPFILLLLTYIIIELHAKDCKPIVILCNILSKSKCIKLKSDKSLIQAFATLFFLSFMKFIGIVLDPFLFASIINMQNKVIYRVSYIDPMVTLFSHKHLLVVFLSAFILIFILLPPIMLLIIYPTKCFRKASSCLKPRWALTLKIFTDTFHGSYKDGTNGTRDYRSIAGFLLMIWILVPIGNTIAVVTLNITYTWLVSIIPILLIVSIACVVLEPYKNKAANISGTVLPIILASAGGTNALLQIYEFSTGLSLLNSAIVTLPHWVFYYYGIVHLVKWIKQRLSLNRDDELERLVQRRPYLQYNTLGDDRRA